MGQIHAVTTAARFAIQRAPRFYIGGDIGNVHAEMPSAIWKPFNMDSVIEIARIIRIDGNDEFVAQIFASGELPCVDLFGNAICLIQNLPRKFCGQMIFPDDREHVDSRGGCRAEHFDDFAFGIEVTRFPSVQANHDFVAYCSGGLLAAPELSRSG